MDKNTFKQEINDNTDSGGKFTFIFGDVYLPDIYHKALNMSVLECRHMRYLDDNLGVLINTLLDKYRQFIDLSMY